MPAPNRRPARHAPDRMTRAYNTTAAYMKIATAPLHILTDAMVESIANSHAAMRDRPALLNDLRTRLAERREREVVRG